MKKVIVCAIVLFISTAPAFAEQVIPSSIKEVTLFSDQALVKRVSEAKVTKGMNELQIEVDAFRVDTDSISAKVFGKGMLFGVQFKEIHLKELPQENIKKLEEKLKALKERQKAIIAAKGVQALKQQFLNSVADFSRTQVPEDIKTSFPKIADLEGALNFLGSGMGGVNEELAKLNREYEELGKEVVAVQRELASLKGHSGKTKKVIEIAFEAREDQNVKVEADYLVYNAYWQPLYKIYVPGNLSNAKLHTLAKINQKTGEDWDDVKLSVSNVIPLKGTRLPTLSSWFLNLYAPMKRKAVILEKARTMSYGLEEGMMDDELCATNAALSYDKKEAEFAFAQRKALPLSFEYKLPGTQTIESKDKETILPLFQKKVKGEFSHYSVPQKSSLCFLTCKAASDKELLDGDMNIYFAGRYVGKTRLTEKKPGEEFKVNLGADREVKVQREKIKDKLDETFFKHIERQTVIKHMAFKIKAENLKDKPVKINILDNLPVSRTDKVEIKDLKIRPEPKKKDYQDKEGVCLWELSLGPKETKEITIEFTVTYPKGVTVSGL